MKSFLISIHPEFVEKIVSGEKKVEFRRKLPKELCRKMYIYCTSPVCKVVGFAKIGFTLTEEKEKLWMMLGNPFGGISKEKYDSYFQGKDTASLIWISWFTEFKKPLELSDFGITKAPQSFCYVDK